MVISACADIDMAVHDVVQSAFGHAGQKCSAASLAIVVTRRLRRPRLLASARRRRREPSRRARVGTSPVQLGPIIRPPEAAARARPRPARPRRAMVGGTPSAWTTTGLRWRPGVKVGVRPGSWSHQHEWFGPVLGVMVAPDFDEAIEWQNPTTSDSRRACSRSIEDECEQWIDARRGREPLRQSRHHGCRRQSTTIRRLAALQRRADRQGGRPELRQLPCATGPGRTTCEAPWPRRRRGGSAWRSTVRDVSGLRAERNLARYRRALAPVAVRVDDSFSSEQRQYLARSRGVDGARRRVQRRRAGHRRPRPDARERGRVPRALVGFAKVRW